MATLYKELKLNGADQELFLKRINMIHKTTNNIRIAAANREKE